MPSGNRLSIVEQARWRFTSLVIVWCCAVMTLAAAGGCGGSQPSGISGGNGARESAAPDNHDAGSERPAELAPSAAPGPNPAASKASLPSESWQIAATLVGHKDVVKALAFSPDGTRLFSGSFDGEIKVWDPRVPEQLASITAHEDGKWLGKLALSPSGEALASGTVRPPGEVRLWDARTLQLRATLASPQTVYSLAFSRNSELLAGAGDYKVYVWNVGDGQRKHTLSVGMYLIHGLAFSPDGRVLYVGGCVWEGKDRPSPAILRAWDLASGTKLGEMELPHGPRGIDLSEDGATLAVAGGAVHVVDVSHTDEGVTFAKRFSARETKPSVTGAPISQEQFYEVVLYPNEKTVACAAGSPNELAPEAGHVALFALEDGRRIARIVSPRPARKPVRPGEYNIFAIAFSLDGKLLAAGGKERIITLWSTEATGRPPVVVVAGDGPPAGTPSPGTTQDVTPPEEDRTPPIENLPDDSSASAREFVEIHREYRIAKRRYVQALKEAKHIASFEEFRKAVDPAKVDLADYVPRLLEISRKDPTDAAAFDSLALAL
ncbi:MAG: WD40 repeat domain-containing protein, partial [Planctomycetota bacterium]